MKNTSLWIFAILTLFLTAIGCNHDEDTTPAPSGGSTDIGPITPSSTVTGYGILSHLPGIWNGPVSSPTPLGSFPEWIVDFRPVSAAQVSAKNELDSVNNILMSFFIVKHANAYKMAFRNGGGFAGNSRISYAVIDSVSESTNNYFYRFADFKAGKNRVYVDVLFKDDSLIMHTYTNIYNTLTTPVTHMLWKAKLQDTSSASAAIAAFSFPQKQMVKDFSTTFDSRTEAIYYNADLAQDPYNDAAQPYLGTTNVNINFGAGYTPDPAKKVFLMITTQPLFTGWSFNSSQLKYRSRYVFVGSTAGSFHFNNMHPGSYYLYGLYDNNGDGSFSTGDWMASNLTNSFTLAPLGTQNLSTTIDFTIP